MDPRIRTVIVFISILVIAAGCASKRYTKKATKFEEAGLYRDAAEYYYEAAKRKDSNVDAKLGLSKNGQLVLDEQLEDFNNSYKQNDYKSAVYHYLEAEAWYNKVKDVGVVLDFPEVNKSYYADARDAYLDARYSEGLEMLNREDFGDARKIFEEILQIEEGYKDAQQQYYIARYEPVYRQGLDYLETGYPRKAYYRFDEILNGTGKYKQALALKEEAREQGTISILIADFKAGRSAKGSLAGSIQASVKSRLSNTSNPFIELIDPSTLSGGIVNRSGINVEAARLAGVNAILYGQVENSYTLAGKPQETTRKGYLKKITKLRNEAGEEVEKVSYKKTKYEEVKIRNESRLEVSFKLVGTRDSQILTSDAYRLSRNDEAHYALFEGSHSKLVPGYWEKERGSSPEDVVKDNRSDVKDLQRLLKAKKTIKSPSTLLNELIDETVSRLVSNVEAYNPEE